MRLKKSNALTWSAAMHAWMVMKLFRPIRPIADDFDQEVEAPRRLNSYDGLNNPPRLTHLSLSGSVTTDWLKGISKVQSFGPPGAWDQPRSKMNGSFKTHLFSCPVEKTSACAAIAAMSFGFAQLRLLDCLQASKSSRSGKPNLTAF